MKTRYSPSTKAFYPYDIGYGDNLPPDVIDVDQQDFNAAMARPVGHTFAFPGGQLVISAPPALTLDQLKAAKLAELSAAFSVGMGVLKVGYPEEEIQSWTKQEAEARNYSPTNSTSAPLLTAMAAARGIPLGELVERVKANADAWTAMSGELIGKRQALEDQVDAATSADKVALVVWAD